MLAHLGGYVGPSWGLCWLSSSLGTRGRRWGLRWAQLRAVLGQLGATLAHLQPKLTYVGSLLNAMLAHVDPS